MTTTTTMRDAIVATCGIAGALLLVGCGGSTAGNRDEATDSGIEIEHTGSLGGADAGADGGVAAVVPHLRFVAPLEGDTLSGAADVELDVVFPEGTTTVLFGVEGYELTELDAYPAFQLLTGDFQDGPQVLIARMLQEGGQELEARLEVDFDNPDFHLESYNTDRLDYFPGDMVELELGYDDDALEVSVTPPGAATVKAEFIGEGQYLARFAAPLGITELAEVELALEASKGDELLKSAVPLRVRDEPLLPIIVEGGQLVDAPLPALTHHESAPEIESVDAPRAILTGGQIELTVRWTQVQEFAGDKIYVRLEGFSGYFVLPVPDTPGERGEVTFTIALPAEAPGLSEEGTPLVIAFTIVDSIGNIVDWFVEDVLGIAVGAKGAKVTLDWNANVDMDLAIIDPNDQLIDFASPSAGSGKLDLDSNAFCEDGPRTESISWEDFTEPTGTYQVRVNLFDACGESSVDWHLVATFCGKTVEKSGTLSAAQVDQSGVGELATTFTVDCTHRVEGKVEYEKVSISGHAGGATTMRPVQFAPLRVVGDESGDQLAAGLTDSAGKYAFSFSNDDDEPYHLELAAAYVDPANSEPRVEVSKVDDDNVHSWKSPSFDPAHALAHTFDFQIRVADKSGALNLQDVMRRTTQWFMRTARSDFRDDLDLVRGRWDLLTPALTRAGKDTAFERNGEIFVSGSVDLQYEWADPVVAHEFMHVIVRELVLHGDMPGGSHGTTRSDPHLSFSEALATVLGQRALGYSKWSKRKRSTVSSVDLESGSASNFGDPALFRDTEFSRKTDRVSEWLVAMLLWDVMDDSPAEAFDRIALEPFTLNVLFEPPPDGDFEDRSDNGIDLVDFLDHFRAGLQNRRDGDLVCLTDDRQFPYDRYSLSTRCLLTL